MDLVAALKLLKSGDLNGRHGVVVDVLVNFSGFHVFGTSDDIIAVIDIDLGEHLTAVLDSHSGEFHVERDGKSATFKDDLINDGSVSERRTASHQVLESSIGTGGSIFLSLPLGGVVANSEESVDLVIRLLLSPDDGRGHVGSKIRTVVKGVVSIFTVLVHVLVSP